MRRHVLSVSDPDISRPVAVAASIAVYLMVLLFILGITGALR